MYYIKKYIINSYANSEDVVNLKLLSKIYSYGLYKLIKISNNMIELSKHKISSRKCLIKINKVNNNKLRNYYNLILNIYTLLHFSH